MPPIRVFVADDDSTYRFLLRETLPDGEIEIVGEAAAAGVIVSGVRDARPHVVLLDQMCDTQTLLEVRLVAPYARVIILSGHHPDDGDRALAAAADGYVVKGADLDALRAAVRG